MRRNAISLNLFAVYDVQMDSATTLDSTAERAENGETQGWLDLRRRTI